MKVIVIRHSRNDRGHRFLKHMLAEGAVPSELHPLVHNFLDEADELPLNCRMLQDESGTGIPVGSLRELIVNHLYGTAQPQFPHSLLDDIKNELLSSFSDTGDILPELSGIPKTVIIRGAMKKAEPEGIGESILEETDPIKIMKDKLEDIKSSKESLDEPDALDLSKIVEELGKLQGLFPEAGESIKKILITIKQQGGKAKIDVKKQGSIADSFAEYIAKYTPLSKKAVLRKIAADSSTEDKVLIGNTWVDAERASESPYDSYESSEKALGKSMANLLCNKATGAINLKKLQKIVDSDIENSILKRSIDSIVRSIEWHGTDDDDD